MPDPQTTALTVGATGLALKYVKPYVGEIARQAQDFIAAVTQHPAESVGTIIGKEVRRRVDRWQTVAATSHFILLNLGLYPGPVADDVLLPLLEASSLPDEERLQEMWANLLANAADPRKLHNVIPVYVTIAKDLSIREVVFLQFLYKRTTSAKASTGYPILRQHYREAGLALHPAPEHLPHYSTHNPLKEQDDALCGTALEIIVRAGIMSHQGNPEGPHRFTNLGWAFMNACQPPTV
jgi:hypothetical protein